MKPLYRPAVLLAEGSVSGHRLAYVKLLAEEALARGQRVHIALPPGGRESPEFRTHLGGLHHRVGHRTITNFGLASLEKLSDEIDVSRTVVTDGDALVFELAKRGRWRGRSRLSVLIMREFAQPDSLRVRMWIKSIVKKAIFWRVSRLAGIDLAVLKSAIWSGKSALRVAIDPVRLECSVSDILRLRTDWNLREDTFWFAILGAVTERKNVPLVATSLASLGSDRIGLLIAGKIDPSVREDIEAATSELTNSGKSVAVVNSILSDVDLDAAVTVADCLVLAHSNEGPSGLLGKAAAAGTRIVAAGAMSLRDDTLQLGNSAEWTSLDKEPLASALNRAMHQQAEGHSLPRSSSSFLEALLPHV